MRFEQTVVVPVAAGEARRLVEELEKRLPVIPGLGLSLELIEHDQRSTKVHLVGDWQGAKGPGSTIVVGVAMRFVRRYADQLVSAARVKAREAASGAGPTRPPAPAPSSDAAPDPARPDAARPDAAGSHAARSHPVRPSTPRSPSPSSADVSLTLRDPAVWVLGLVGLLVLSALVRRRRR